MSIRPNKKCTERLPLQPVQNTIALVIPFLFATGLFLFTPMVAGAAAPSVAGGAAPIMQEAPTLLTPENGAETTGETDPPLGLPRLVWSVVPNAERYRVQVSSSSSFIDPVINSLTYMTSYTPQIAFPDGRYYWRVQVQLEGEWSPYSETYTFAKDWTDDGGLSPKLYGPADNSEIASFGFHEVNWFLWEAVPGAAFYNIDLSTDESVNNLVYSAEMPSTQHSPPQRFLNGTYFWRVTPVDNQGNHGESSETRSFRFNWSPIPSPYHPKHESIHTSMPFFEWKPVEAAKTYALEISTDPDFSAPQRHTVQQNSYTPPKNLANDQEYYWRVQAVDYVGNSTPWSEVLRFRMRWNFQAELLTPQNNMRSAYAFLQWTPIPGAERYQLQVDESTSFDTPLVDEEIYNVTAHAFTDRLDSRVHYGQDLFWRVRGMDAQDNVTPWSRISTYRLSDSFGPNLIYPAQYYTPDSEHFKQALDNATGWPLFMWNTVHARDIEKQLSHAPDYYELTVSTDSAFQAIKFLARTAGQAAVPTVNNPFEDLTDDQPYYWRVRAFRDGVQQGGDSVGLTQFKAAERAAMESDAMTLIYPADSFEATEVPPLLGWQPVRQADHYRVQISRSNNFTAPAIIEEGLPTVPNYVPWQGQQAGSVYQQMPVGAYWWRVQAENGADSPIGTWSVPRRFHLSHNLVNGNRYDLVPPPYPSSILSPTQQFDPTVARVATNAEPNQDQYRIDNLHVMLNRVDLYSSGYPTEPSNYDWILSFEVTDTTDTLVYGIYIDTNHAANSGATYDPRLKPIETDDLYRPEYALYITRTAGVSSNQIEYFRWTGSDWTPPQTLSAIGGDAWFDVESSAIQLLIPYTAIGAGDTDFTGSLAIAAFSTSVNTQDGIVDAVPAQGTKIDTPTWVSDMPMPVLPFTMPQSGVPQSGQAAHYKVPALHWYAESYDSVDGYQVQLAHDREFTDIVETATIYESGTVSSYSWLPAAFQSIKAYEDNESYYWRVRVRHERFNLSSFDYGPWSMPMRFKLDSQQVDNLWPLSDISLNEFKTPRLRWRQVEGASGYTIQIDESPSFSRPLINEKVDGTSFTPPDSLADGTWYWRVAMRRSGRVQSRWTETLTFIKRKVIDTYPPLSYDEDPYDEQPLFFWESITTEGEPLHSTPRYQFQIDSNPSFSRPKTVKADSPSVTFTKKDSLADGTWYWRVATLDAENQVGTYGPTREFKREYLAPEVTLYEPIFTAGNVNLTWRPVAGAANYEVQYDDNESFSSPKKIKTDNAQFAPVENLSLGDYYWRVRMIDADKNYGPFQDWTFSVQLPTPTPTHTPTETPTPPNTPSPTITPTPTNTRPATSTPLPMNTLVPTATPQLATLTPPPTAQPTPANKATPTPISAAGQKVVINEVYYLGESVGEDWIELQNRGDEPVDISNWWLCSRESCQVASQIVMAQNADLLLDSGEFVVLPAWTDLKDAADLALYVDDPAAENGKPDFTRSALMVDFVQWGSAEEIGYASVAVEKGIWRKTEAGLYDYVPSALSNQTLALIQNDAGSNASHFSNSTASEGQPNSSIESSNSKLYLPFLIE